MLRLGHIEYSNCFPVHARLIEQPSQDIEIVSGVPSALNRALAEGRIDVAPCSSIEYARHAGEYRVLPDFVIGADGAVESILLDSRRPLEELDGAEVALPTASATSIVLLRILLELRLGVKPRYRWFDQDASGAPSAAAASLRIGDAALLREPSPAEQRTDLGTAWKEWTGLPFAFAVWQTRLDTDRDPDLAALHRALDDSFEYFQRNAAMLAERHAARFGIPAARLLAYWQRLQFRMNEEMLQGLRRFYACAAELQEVPGMPEMRWTPTA